MKTTLELPDSLLRRAKATAAQRGQTMTAFVKAALESKLAANDEPVEEKPWMQFAGIFSDKEESQRIMDRIEESCGQVDSEDWK